jgi:predicted nucleic acid-binding protein
VLLVIDAGVALDVAMAEAGFGLLEDHELAAPPLLWSETLSVLHELLWRREISPKLASIAMDRLGSAPVRRRRPPSLSREAWRIAEDLGWAKTYDAEYVALAGILDCPLLTVDARLKRGASRVVRMLGPADL